MSALTHYANMPTVLLTAPTTTKELAQHSLWRLVTYLLTFLRIVHTHGGMARLSWPEWLNK